MRIQVIVGLFALVAMIALAGVSQATPKIAVKEIPIAQLPADVAPDEAWTNYFARFSPTPESVREAVRRLMNDARFDQVIGLINASLRNHNAQPWMYEVLVLAMEADGRDPEELERAIMSAADFAQNPADMMHLGVYLTRLGLHDRAMQVYREVAKAEPLWAEPYIMGLKLAQQNRDAEGIQWATVGILSKAWQNDQKEIWQQALYAANDTLQKLRKGRDTRKQAKDFERALDKAVERDVLVRVRWTGGADIDLLVEEPSGTVCSLRNPRTSAGGVLMGDGFSDAARNPHGAYEEVYVCPQGFKGTYRVLVRRVWGKVTAGKVHVEVIKHYRGSRPEQLSKSIPLKDDEALVVFDLEEGQRTEPLKDHQLATAAQTQIALSRQILSRQLAAAEDPRAAGRLAVSRRANAASPNPGSLAFRGPNAAGYQPVIITLPEGANLAATAVVSADRRYIRITTVPLFSGIAEVNVFNTVTGETTEGNGGTDGRGFSQIFNDEGVASQGSGLTNNPGSGGNGGNGGNGSTP
jgi:tetratricopeptide (TPR) repeat protein